MEREPRKAYVAKFSKLVVNDLLLVEEGWHLKDSKPTLSERRKERWRGH